MDLGLVLEMALANDPDRLAVSTVDGAGLTVDELARKAEAAARVFAGTRSTHIGYCGVNGLALPVTLFGASRAGLPFVPLNYRLADEQLADVASRHDLAVVAGRAEATRLRSLGVRQTIEPAELLTAQGEAAEPVGTRHEPDADAVAVLIYTSGTTASPKAAILRHRHLTAYVIGSVEFASMEPTDAVLVSVPPYHVAGVMNLVSNLYAGRRIVYLDPFDAEAWVRVVDTERITHAMVVPTMLARIVKVLEAGTPTPPSLRSISYGGAPMPSPVIEKALDLLPDVAFANAYGLTETSSTITVLGPEDHRAAREPGERGRLRSVGRPLPGIELEVRDEEGRACRSGQVGTIHVRGEQVAGEYAGVGTAPGEWFDTRDRGHLDADGYLFIEGRADDTIIRGGENIAPAEVEEVLLRHPAVTECAVVGLADEEWGQRVAAIVVLEPGANVAPDELTTFARGHLRTSKSPEVILVEPALPYTETGKVLRRVVRERLALAMTAAPAEALLRAEPASS